MCMSGGETVSKPPVFTDIFPLRKWVTDPGCAHLYGLLAVRRMLELPDPTGSLPLAIPIVILWTISGIEVITRHGLRAARGIGGRSRRNRTVHHRLRSHPVRTAAAVAKTGAVTHVSDRLAAVREGPNRARYGSYSPIRDEACVAVRATTPVQYAVSTSPGSGADTRTSAPRPPRRAARSREQPRPPARPPGMWLPPRPRRGRGVRRRVGHVRLTRAAGRAAPECPRGDEPTGLSPADTTLVSPTHRARCAAS